MVLAITQLGAAKTGSSNSFTSDSVSPSANALLGVVTGSKDNTAITQNDPTETSITNVGAWTTRAAQSNLEDGSYAGLSLHTAQVSGSAGTGTLTANFSATQSAAVVIFFEITGHDTTTPFAQAVVEVNGSASSLAVNLGSAPNASNIVITGCADRDFSGTLGEPSGMTELDEAAQGSAMQLSLAYKIGSASQNNSWTLTGSKNFGFIAEISLAPVSSGAPGSMLLVAREHWLGWRQRLSGLWYPGHMPAFTSAG